MPDKIGEVAATGGSRPAETGPGASGGTATGGSQAVPSAETLMGDDSATGDTVADEAKASATPKMSPGGPDTPKDADAPSGGLGGVSSVGGA